MADASNVIITDEGTIDGGDSYWWMFVPLSPEQYPSELVVRFEEVRSGNQ